MKQQVVRKCSRDKEFVHIRRNGRPKASGSSVLMETDVTKRKSPDLD